MLPSRKQLQQLTVFKDIKLSHKTKNFFIVNAWTPGQNVKDVPQPTVKIYRYNKMTASEGGVPAFSPDFSQRGGGNDGSCRQPFIPLSQGRFTGRAINQREGTVSGQRESSPRNLANTICSFPFLKYLNLIFCGRANRAPCDFLQDNRWQAPLVNFIFC